MNTPMQNVGRKMATGAAWMVGFRLLDRAVGLISTIILARLLVPEDFGLVAMATSVIAIGELLQAFNFDVALIQNQNANAKDYNSAWTLNILLAAGCALLLCIGAYPMALFFGDPRVELVIYWLAGGMFVQGFENIGIIAFRKELTLHKEFWFLLAKRMTTFVITITCALLMRSYWALIIGMVSGRILGVALTYWVHPYRPSFTLARAHGLFHFSKWLLLTNALATARLRAADIIVGRMSGAHGLGLFSMSYEISNLPSTELAAPINRAVFPGYAAMSQDDAALKDSVTKVMSLIILITVPASIGIALVAEPLVLTLLGHKWIESAPLIKILALFGLANALQSNLGYVFIAKGRAKYITIWAAVMLALLVPLVFLGTRYYGVTGAALGALASVTLPMPVFLFSVSRLIRLTLADWVSMVWRPLLSTGLMSIAVLYWLASPSMVLNGMATPLQLLLGAVSLGAIVYGCAITLFWLIAGRPAGPESYLLRGINAQLSRRRA